MLRLENHRSSLPTILHGMHSTTTTLGYQWKVLRDLPRLEHWEIEREYVMDRMPIFETICSRLKTLKLTSCLILFPLKTKDARWPMEKLSVSGSGNMNLTDILSRCPFLKALELEDVDPETVKQVERILFKLENLTHLAFDDAIADTIAGPAYTTGLDNSSWEVLPRLKKLKCLRLTGRFSPVLNRPMVNALMNMKSLETIHSDWPPSVEDQETCRSIKQLEDSGIKVMRGDI